MQGYNFTERVRLALARAREESARLRHEYVGTEHILLGLLRDDESLAIAIIESFDVRPETLAQKIDGVVKPGRPASGKVGPDLPYTSRAKKVLELSMEEARDLNHDYVGTEHLLLGLLREERGIAAQLLVDSGVTLDHARARAIEILGGPGQPSLRVSHADAVAKMKAWGPNDRAGDPASGQMAASVIELLAQDTGVGAVFAAQGVDVAKLAAGLRALGSPPAGDAPPPA
jgi:ATP-dependent Clp protease ATP-binding subunit ClpA